MFYKKNVDFVALLWEDFMFQADNRDISSAHKENIPYPRFNKVIINRFMSKDKTISMMNMINLHIIQDDSLLGTLKYVSKIEDYQKYGALIPEQMINQAIQDSKEYKIYLAFATREATPKKVPDELQDKKINTNKETATKPGVFDVPKDQSESENESWGKNDDSDNDGGDNNGDDERTESDKDENPNLNQNDDDKEEEYDDEYVRTPTNYESTDDENEHVNEEEYDRIDEELYKDVNVKFKDVEQGGEREEPAKKA
nr:hypothetical protein [Tanacetum cinerariifolium]